MYCESTIKVNKYPTVTSLRTVAESMIECLKETKLRLRQQQQQWWRRYYVRRD